MAVKSETAVRETTVRAIGTSERVVVTGKAPASVRTQTVGRTMASMRMQMAAEAARRAVADTARAVSEEVRESFRAWVERNFLNARAGRIGNVSYARAGELDDAVPESGPRGARRESRRLWYAEAYDRALVDHM